MTTGGHPPPEYAQKSLYVQQPSLRVGVFMVHQHYGTQTVNRGAVMPGMLVKHKDGRRDHCKRAARTVLTGMCYSVGSATRQGSSSPTRFIGQSAMTSRT